MLDCRRRHRGNNTIDIMRLESRIVERRRRRAQHLVEYAAVRTACVCGLTDPHNTGFILQRMHGSSSQSTRETECRYNASRIFVLDGDVFKSAKTSMIWSGGGTVGLLMGRASLR